MFVEVGCLLLEQQRIATCFAVIKKTSHLFQ